MLPIVRQPARLGAGYFNGATRRHCSTPRYSNYVVGHRMDIIHNAPQPHAFSTTQQFVNSATPSHNVSPHDSRVGIGNSLGPTQISKTTSRFLSYSRIPSSPSVSIAQERLGHQPSVAGDRLRIELLLLFWQILQHFFCIAIGVLVLGCVLSEDAQDFSG
jgi:hypothetical protein